MNYKTLLALFNAVIAINGYPINSTTSTVEDSSRYQSQVCYDITLAQDEDSEIESSIVKCIDFSISNEKYNALTTDEPLCLGLLIDGEENPLISIQVEPEDFIQVDVSYGQNLDNGEHLVIELNSHLESLLESLDTSEDEEESSEGVYARGLDNETVTDEQVENEGTQLDLSTIEGIQLNNTQDLEINNVFGNIVENEKVNETNLYWESKHGYHVASTPGIVDINEFAIKVFNSEIGVSSISENGDKSKVDWVSFNWVKTNGEIVEENNDTDTPESNGDGDLKEYYDTLFYRFCGFAPRKQFIHGAPSGFQELDYSISGEYYLNTWGPVGGECINVDPYEDA